MKVALAQFAPVLGDVGRNLETHLDLMDKARRAKADLVVFPELSLTGYTLKDLAADVALDPASDRRFRRIVEHSRGLSVVLGFMEESPAARGLFYNAAAFVSGGKVLHVHRKVYLPTNGLFEEAKFFAQGRDFRVFPTPFGRVGLLICRDFLHYGASYVLFSGGAEIIITISAAPGRGVAGTDDGFETSRMWELMGEAISYFSTAFVLYANRVGLEDGVSFAGGSFIYGPAGRLLARAAYLDPEFLVHSLDLTAVREARARWLFRRDEKPEVIFRSLERVLRAPED
ncbi:MAG TPA: nitrilase-related carbon-nitrogen hydrolase [Terriglobales bacterium]|nr:nitrilase-related carbon-nitrogen hydrolase [Terriglobales bacterium]